MTHALSGLTEVARPGTHVRVRHVDARGGPAGNSEDTHPADCRRTGARAPSPRGRPGVVSLVSSMARRRARRGPDPGEGPGCPGVGRQWRGRRRGRATHPREQRRRHAPSPDCLPRGAVRPAVPSGGAPGPVAAARASASGLPRPGNRPFSHGHGEGEQCPASRGRAPAAPGAAAGAPAICHMTYGCGRPRCRTRTDGRWRAAPRVPVRAGRSSHRRLGGLRTRVSRCPGP